MTVKPLSMVDFLTLYAVKPGAAGVDSGQDPRPCTGFKTPLMPYQANFLKLLEKKSAVFVMNKGIGKSAVPLHTHPAPAGRCTITHTPAAPERIPFHIAVAWEKMRRELRKYLLMNHFSAAVHVLSHTYADVQPPVFSARNSAVVIEQSNHIGNRCTITHTENQK